MDPNDFDDDRWVFAGWAMLATIMAFGLHGCATDVISTPSVIKEPVVEKCQFPEIEAPRLYASEVDPDDPRALVKGSRALQAEIKEREAHRLRLEAAIEACKRNLSQ